MAGPFLVGVASIHSRMSYEVMTGRVSYVKLNFSGLNSDHHPRRERYLLHTILEEDKLSCH
jgi:hypothetical protein